MTSGRFGNVATCPMSAIANPRPEATGRGSRARSYGHCEIFSFLNRNKVGPTCSLT